MKTGPAILVLAGILIVAAVMFMPRSPEVEGAHEHDHGTAEHETTSTQSSTYSLADSLVDDALEKMQSGTLPPMQAVLSIRDISERFPENVKANFTLGLMSMQTSQFEKAVDRFEKVLAQDASNSDAIFALASARKALGDTAAAIEGLNHALETLTNEETKNAIREELASINNN